MPVYEYQCRQCASRFEIKKKIDENSPVRCPRCGGSARHVFQPVPIIFKGSGFYCTDSKGGSSH